MHTNSIFPCTSQRNDPLILVEEISHRVFNEYSQAIAGITLAARSVISNEAKAILITAAARLLKYAEAHRALQAPRSSEAVDLGDYIRNLCAAMRVSSLQERGVHLIFTADAVTLPSERCWRVALIVSELITNCVRHGLKNGPGTIRVEIEGGGRDVACRITDDGRGSRSPKPGRGFAVVSGLAEQLGGAVGWCFTPEGTTAELNFPHTIEESQA
jgi:two-component sensor histidine kinase